MRNNILVIFTLIILSLGCKKEEAEPIIAKPADPPKSITIFSGNNQTGYPNLFLPDTIILKIIPKKTADLFNYSFYFAQANNYSPVELSHDTIINNELLVYARWRLNDSYQSQEMTFYLTEKDTANDPEIWKKLDSISITASIKQPWVEIYTGGTWPLYDMHFSDDNNGIIIGHLPFKPGYLRTIDGGETFFDVDSPRNDLYMLSFSDPDTGIVIVTNNYGYFTVDGGQSFFEDDWSVPIIGDRSSSDYFMFNSKKILTVGRQGRISKSLDGGKSWEAYQGFSFINDLSDLACPDNNTCYACGSVGKVIKTSNAGNDWEEQETQLNNSLKKIYFIDNKFGFAAGQNGILIRTINGGENWEIINSEISFTIIEIYFHNRDFGYIVSSVGEIGKTLDGGLSWEKINRSHYGVSELRRAHFKENIIFGLQEGSIFKYHLDYE